MGEETVKFLRQSNGLVTLKHQPNPKLVTIVDRNYLQELRIQQWQRTSIPVIALLFSIAFLSLTLGPFLIRRAPDLTQVNYTSPIESASLEPDFNWWRKYPIYLAKPTVFGDWKGFISKVKNLKELGIKIIWISPIFDSLSIDLTLGYNQTFENGTIDDFQLLVRHLHANGIKVILDFVPNHTSVKHRWFRESRTGTKGTYSDYYVWKWGIWDKGKKRYLPPNNGFDSDGTSLWTFDSTRKQFYFHQFSSGQPDLNYRSLKVRQEIKEILKFWVELGIDGLFLADILYLMEPKFENAKKQMSQPGNILPETYQLIEDWIDQVSKLSNNRIFTVTNEIMTGYQQSLENIGIDLVLNSTACSLTPVNDPDGFNLLNCTTKYVD